MTQRLWIPVLILANLVIPIAILIFATGFFPYKPFVTGTASFEHAENDSTHATAPFDKVIFMVVDALRRLDPLSALTAPILTFSATLSIPGIQASSSLRGQHGWHDALRWR